MLKPTVLLDDPFLSGITLFGFHLDSGNSFQLGLGEGVGVGFAFAAPDMSSPSIKELISRLRF